MVLASIDLASPLYFISRLFANLSCLAALGDADYDTSGCLNVILFFCKCPDSDAGHLRIMIVKSFVKH